MNSSESESDMNSFLDQMAAEFEKGIEENKFQKQHRDNLIMAYLRINFMRRSLGTIELEAQRFNDTFFPWMERQAESFGKGRELWHLKVAEIAGGLGPDDVDSFCDEQLEVIREKQIPIMPGTTEARRLSANERGWEFIHEVIDTAKRVQ
jgi:hypothetical protein